jgi:outer membrane protein assembly factor BamB
MGVLCGMFVLAAAWPATAFADDLQVSPGPPSQWTQFRLNSRNDARVHGSLEVSWRIKTGGGFSSSPTVHANTLFIGNNAGQFFAVDLKTGAVAWSKQYSSSLMAAPLVYNGAVYLGEGNQNSYRIRHTKRNVVGSGTNAIIALDATSGQQLWSLPLQGSGMPTGAVIGGVLVQHDGAGYVSGVDPHTGELRFSHALGSVASMSAALPVGGDRFITSGSDNGGGVNATWEMRASDGTIVWKHEFDDHFGAIGDCPSATDGARVFCDYVAPGAGLVSVNVGAQGEMHAYALSLADGTSVWDLPLESGAVPMMNEAAIPLVAHGALYVGNSLAPWMHAVDAVNGHLLWRTQVRGPVKGGVVRSQGAVYFGDLSGYLWALDESDGHVIGVKNMHTSFNVGSPVLYGRTLFIGTKNGEIIAVPVAQIRASSDP